MSQSYSNSLERQKGAVERMRTGLEKQATSRQIQAVRKQNRGATDDLKPAFFILEAPPKAPFPAVSSECDPLPGAAITSIVNRAAEQNGLDPELVRAVAVQESGLLPCAVSPKGALGLMQLMPETSLDLGVRNPFDPEQNVSGGARLLHDLLSRYRGDLSLSLAAYNAGPVKVDKVGGIPDFPETVQYVDAILRAIKSPNPH